MKKRLFSVLLAIILVFAPLSVGAKNESKTDRILRSMTMREKVEQMMLVSYRVWEETPESGKGSDEASLVNVTELNNTIRADLMGHDYGGVLLFGENFVDARQTLRLVSDIQDTNLKGGGLPLLVTVDQEGGSVARISFGTSGVGNMALAATGDPSDTTQMAEIYGKEMSLLGLNTDFAPVVDVNNNPNNPIIGCRSFSDSPKVVAEYGVSYIEGLHETGTIATLKHFPGHGNTDTDSHTGFPLIESTYEELKNCELIPFREAIDAGADMVMTAHIQYPKIETGTYTSVSTGKQVYLPATMSHKILTDILRKDMGFEGVIVSDALDMAAITENFADEDVLSMTINAGVNLLILPPVFDSKGFKHLDDMVETAVRLAEDGTIDTQMIDDSVRRILTLKEKYGLLDISDFSVTEEKLLEAEKGVGSSANRDVAWNIANKSLTVVKNENNAFPISLGSKEKALILFADNCASRSGAGKLAARELIKKGIIADESQIIVIDNADEDREKCIIAAKEADHCILVQRTYNAACLNPGTDDGSFSAVFDEIIASRHENGKKVVVVSCSLPYDAARFMDADACVLSYNSTTMREIPNESGKGSAYAPNLVAALVSCFGNEERTGILPVNIPEIDKDYKMTEKILYKRGY